MLLTQMPIHKHTCLHTSPTKKYTLSKLSLQFSEMPLWSFEENFPSSNRFHRFIIAFYSQIIQAQFPNVQIVLKRVWRKNKNLLCCKTQEASSIKPKTQPFILLIVFIFAFVCFSVLVLLCSIKVFNFAIMCYLSVLLNFRRTVLEKYVSRMGKRVILRQNYILSLPLTKTQ